MKLYEFTRSYEMFEEAKKYVPNGIYGPRSPLFLPFGSYPAFLKRGEGCRIWDVDGNEYIDYMCSFGTNLLGLKHPKIDAAAKAQMEKADCFTLPSDLWIPLAKKMTSTVKGGDWCVFGKNGSDVTSYAITVARVHTGRAVILIAKGSYHGSHFWCQTHGEGVPAEWKTHLAYFEYNDVADFKRVVDENRGKVAAVILTPHRHDALCDQELPKKEFVDAVNATAGSEGFDIIVDDIRCGFRLDLQGSARHYGFNADQQTFGKAMANGYPIAVAAGRSDLKPPPKSLLYRNALFLRCSLRRGHRNDRRDQVERRIQKIDTMGKKLMKGLEEAASATGVKVTLSGPPAMPYMTFENDPTFETNRYFCGEAARRGFSSTRTTTVRMRGHYR